MADVQSASQVLAAEIPQVLASPSADPVRVKHVIDGVERFLETADQKSQGQTPVRKEIAKVYRQVGDFQSTVKAPQIANKRAAVGTYQHAAAVAASVPPADQRGPRSSLRNWAAADFVGEQGGSRVCVSAAGSAD